MCKLTEHVILCLICDEEHQLLNWKFWWILFRMTRVNTWGWQWWLLWGETAKWYNREMEVKVFWKPSYVYLPLPVRDFSRETRDYPLVWCHEINLWTMLDVYIFWLPVINVLRKITFASFWDKGIAVGQHVCKFCFHWIRKEGLDAFVMALTIKKKWERAI